MIGEEAAETEPVYTSYHATSGICVDYVWLSPQVCLVHSHTHTHTHISLQVCRVHTHTHTHIVVRACVLARVRA
jgi:hypothetical protein